MKKKTDQEFYARLRELEDAGVPIDGRIADRLRKAVCGLEVVQIGGAARNSIFAGAAGTLGVLIELAIDNISLSNINIVQVDLALPFYAEDFRWLPRPVSPYQGYVLDECGPHPFDRTVVLNEHLGRDFVVRPGLSVTGVLLGASLSPVPLKYPDRSKIPAELKIFTTREMRYSHWLDIMVCRHDQRRIAVNPPSGKRLPLLDPAARDAAGVGDVCGVRSGDQADEME